MAKITLYLYVPGNGSHRNHGQNHRNCK